MIEIAIERTRGGYPAIREHTNGDLKSLIVLNERGKRKKANKNNLVHIDANDLCIVCIYHGNEFYGNEFFINIYKILEIEEGYMYVDKVNKNGYDIPEHLNEAVETAKRLAIKGEDHHD